jgi:hypothetical protein
LERLKDDPLLFVWNADAGVADLERHDGPRSPEDGVVFTPTFIYRSNSKTYSTLLGELKGIGKQVFQHLLQTLGVGDKTAIQVRIG